MSVAADLTRLSAQLLQHFQWWSWISISTNCPEFETATHISRTCPIRLDRAKSDNRWKLFVASSKTGDLLWKLFPTKGKCNFRNNIELVILILKWNKNKQEPLPWGNLFPWRVISRTFFYRLSFADRPRTYGIRCLYTFLDLHKVPWHSFSK